MEIYFFDEYTISPVGVIETETALSYTEKYCGLGSWNIWSPLNSPIKRYLGGNYLVSLDSSQGLFGLLRTREKEGKSTKVDIILGGKTTQGYLEDRIVWGTYSAENKNSSEIAYDLVTQSMITPIPPNPRRVLPGVVIDPSRGVLGASRNFQTTSKTIGSAITNLLEADGLGYRFVTNVRTHTHKFQIYQGIDRSIHQRDRPWVVFSREFDNIIRSTYSRYNDSLKNVAYVGGAGEGLERIWVPVNDELYSGFARRELSVDARDIQEDESTQLLITRGIEKLGECQEVENFEGHIVPGGRFTYGRDYFLGDIVTFEDPDLGFSLDARVNQAKTVYKGNSKQVTITFGFQMPTLKSILNR